MVDLKSRNFISISDFSPKELNYVVNLAIHLEGKGGELLNNEHVKKSYLGL